MSTVSHCCLLQEGRLFLTGRAKEVLILRGANFHCYELEDTVGALPGIATARVAATSVRDASTGTEALLIFFVVLHHTEHTTLQCGCI